MLQLQTKKKEFSISESLQLKKKEEIMRDITFQIDYTFCPKGHGDWVFVPSSTLYADVFWCEKCDCFYSPTVEKMTKEKLNKEFYSDRAADIIERAKFLKWKDGLNYSDMKNLSTSK